MLGSGEEDILWSGVTLTDNSIVLVGHTNADSANGTVSQGNFGPLYTFDGWIVKVDNGGNILWDRRHGGGGGDAFAGIALAPDRGFWVTGALDSLGLYPTINDTIPRGGQDIQLLKFDSLGIKQWDKRYGGNADDGAADILYVPDANQLILAASSRSDAGFEKTEQCFGNYDFWVVATDTLGNKLWDKTYGGYAPFEDDRDCKIIDRGNQHYLLAGPSGSPISGNKTVAPQDSVVGAPVLYPDMWVIAFHYDSTAMTVEQNTSLQLQLYPNPANQMLTISLSMDVRKPIIEITDMLGRTMKTHFNVADNHLLQVDVQHLPSGMYQLCLKHNGYSLFKKFIKM